MFSSKLSYIIYINLSLFYTSAPAFLLRINTWLFLFCLFIYFWNFENSQNPILKSKK